MVKIREEKISKIQPGLQLMAVENIIHCDITYLTQTKR